MLVANRKNLKNHAKDLLGNEWSPEREKALIRVALKGPDEYRVPGHFSHTVYNWLSAIDEQLGTHGVETLYHAYGANDGIDLDYCNTGDTYALTIYWYKGKLRIGDIGSILERVYQVN